MVWLTSRYFAKEVCPTLRSLGSACTSRRWISSPQVIPMCVKAPLLGQGCIYARA
jgi:hypothetical protein